MTPLFKKLNLGEHRTLIVLDAPETFEAELSQLAGATIHRSADAIESVPFLLTFVKTLAEVQAAARIMARAPGDPILWVAYPKGSSKRYRCEFNRDTGWDAMGQGGFEPVRQVAIDEDWSALRFRRVEFIKNLTRNTEMILSEAGKARASKRK